MNEPIRRRTRADVAAVVHNAVRFLAGTRADYPVPGKTRLGRGVQPIAGDKADPQQPLAHLDCIDHVQAACMVEDDLGIQIPDASLNGIDTVDDLIAAACQQCGITEQVPA